MGSVVELKRTQTAGQWGVKPCLCRNIRQISRTSCLELFTGLSFSILASLVTASLEAMTPQYLTSINVNAFQNKFFAGVQ